MSKQHVVTSIGEAPEIERKRRMIKYAISMSIRFLCVILVVFTSGIWQWIFGLGAIFLPYFAVVLANNVENKSGTKSKAVSLEPLKIEFKNHDNRFHE